MSRTNIRPSHILLPVVAAVLWLWLSVSPHAQTVFTPQEDTAPAVTLPEELTPEIVDGLLARMTDAEIRAILRDELVRRAEAEAMGEEDMTLEQIQTRLVQMAAQIEERTTRWMNAIQNLGDRADRVRQQMALAENGVGAMVVAALAVLLAGIAAATATSFLTRAWRSWLSSPTGAGYWERVLRTVLLGLVEILPIIGFLGGTRVGFWMFTGPDGAHGTLGLLRDYQWIYEAGIWNSWLFIVITRRAFSPDAPAIRIAPLDDDLAGRLHRLLRTAVQIGAAGWLVGGIMLHAGLGFPPTMVLRALAGTVIAVVLLNGLWNNRAQIKRATGLVFARPDGSMARTVVALAPTIFGFYILSAWVYWLAHWLETGTDRLAGPAGTLIVYLVLPILDRMGRETVASIMRARTPMALRFQDVFFGAWRAIIGLVAIIVVANLWGLDLVNLAIGPGAPAWATTACDVVVTLLLGYLIWNLIGAALYSEKRVSDASEDVDPSSVPAASRLDTLVPLFRNTLLAFLATAILMIVLAALGVDIGPLIASAGIIGIAVGFGAQSLVRDVFAGVFFLVDDAFRVGEYIELDADTRGEVESISVRSMQIRHHRGPVITIPFGEMKQIMNHNRDWVIYKMSFRMEPDTDPQKFKKLVKEVGKEFLVHPEHGPKFLEPAKSQGVYYVDDDSALVMRVKFKCKPRAQFVLRRELYHRLRAVFAENDLKLARRKVEVVGTGGGLDEAALEEAAAAANDPPPAVSAAT
ncbi:MAG: mechanosensitive ion channel family protein [Pseudomonadota bacterium]